MTVWLRAHRVTVLGAAFSLLATCRDDPAGLGRSGPGYFAIRPVYATAVDPAAFGLVADTVRVVVMRPPVDTLRAFAVYFDPDSSEIRLVVDVVLRAAVESLTVHLELRGGGFALFSGTRALEVRAGRGATPPQEIAVTYTGPGSDIAVLTIEPRDSVLTFGDSLRFRAAARDAAGAPVTPLYVAWSSSDTSVLRVNGAGMARAPRARAALHVRARAPSDVTDSTPVTIVPVPTALAAVSGGGQNGVVGRTLPQPLRVRVTAADGLGVKGIPLRFRALGSGGGGAAVRDSLVVSDAGGYAETAATLGTVAGPQSFEASAAALPALSFASTAAPDVASPATSVVTASAATVLSGATATLTLATKDQYGNVVTTGGLTVDFRTTGGTSTGTISGTTDNGDGTYTAIFTGVRAGTATTIVATIGGAAVTSALPAIAVAPGPLARVLVIPPTATLGALGITQRFTAVGQDANGNVVPGQTSGWTSSAPAVATVDGTGAVTAVANGTAVISATTAGVTGQATLTVSQVVATVLVTPASGAIATLPGALRFTAVAADPRGNPIPGATFTWTSSAPGVADVDQTGLATGLIPGAATITATAGGVSGMATLSVAQAVASVTVTPASATLTSLGLTQQFSAVARDAAGNVVPGQSFTWTSSPGGVAAVDPATGLLTAIANGTATLTATTGGVSGTASVTVAQAVTSVTVNPATATVTALGLTQPFSAVAKDANGYVVPGSTFTWTSSQGAVVAVDPTTGLATALGNGTATITATTGGVSGAASLSVAQVVTAVTVSPAAATLTAVGSTQQFTAVATDATGNPVPGQTVSWNAAPPAIASVDQNGLATGLATGAATIKATAAGVSGTATLSVAQAVASVEVSPGATTLDAFGRKRQFSAVAKDAGGNVIPGPSFTWTSSNDLVATVDPSGLATAVGNGPATITATTGGVSGAATLTVSQVVTTVVVSPATATLTAVGDAQQFTAAAQDATGNPVAGQTFTWASSAPAIASVDQSGLAQGLAIGSATITATAAGVLGSASLSVAQVIAAIDVSPATATLTALGLTRQFTAVAKDANGNAILGQAFSWTSSPPGVAVVDAATGLVTAIGNGTATITAAAGAVTGSAQLSVAQVVSSVTVSPATATLGALGLTRQFTATAKDATGNVVAGQAFAWRSSAPAVAAIDATGLAVAIGNGATMIEATAAGVSGSATLAVSQVVVAVEVSPATASLNALGLTQQFGAVAKDARGNAVAGQTFSWTSSAPGVATADGTGLVTAVANGAATITATAAGVSGSAGLTVSQVVVQVDLNPATAALDALGLTRQFSAVARDANGNVVPGRTFSWTSSAPAVATVDGTGLATAIGNGTATITATTGSVSGAATLTVSQVVTAVSVSPATASLSALNLTQRFTAVARDANARTVAGQVFAWSSSAPAIATVDQTGLATALAIGSATITATTAGVTGTATLSVSLAGAGAAGAAGAKPER